MINKKCFTTEWINTKSIELNYSDKNLIEKVIRAFSLLDMLASSGCPFYFKGGSSLMLMFNEGTHRLSIDIDIMCPPGTDIEKYLSEYANNGFISYQLIERKQAGKQVPKEHSKFFYKVAFNEDLNRNSFVLLDVLYENCHYEKIERVAIAHDLIESIGEQVYVNIPSIGDILGDKLTAFAPETTGIPYYKGENLSTLEIIKQLYDIGRLFDKVINLYITRNAFTKIAPIELAYKTVKLFAVQTAEDTFFKKFHARTKQISDHSTIEDRHKYADHMIDRCPYCTEIQEDEDAEHDHEEHGERVQSEHVISFIKFRLHIAPSPFFVSVILL